ncbi:MAG TPA: hypothetical protein VK003_05855 [Oceanobacillus sp.]|nr:hypothetical protein [Oceanobacillus sp.]
MNYQKMDTALLMALEKAQDQDALTVFIQAAHPLQQPEAEYLHQLAVTGDLEGKEILTATLTTDAVKQLSDQAWVRSLTLSQPLKPLKSDC